MSSFVLVRHGRFLSTTCLAIAFLGGCATPSDPPTPVQAPSSAPATSEPAPATAAPDSSPDPKALFQELREAFATLPAQMAETSDGRIHITVPSDLSFALNQADVGPDFDPVLDALADSLRRHSGAMVHIVGHTDSSGRAAGNLALSLRRAESTRDALVARQVGAQRLSVAGMGQEEPVGDNRSVQGRAMNRRVEIFIVPQ